MSLFKTKELWSTRLKTSVSTDGNSHDSTAFSWFVLVDNFLQNESSSVQQSQILIAHQNGLIRLYSSNQITSQLSCTSAAQLHQSEQHQQNLMANENLLIESQMKLPVLQICALHFVPQSSDASSSSSSSAAKDLVILHPRKICVYQFVNSGSYSAAATVQFKFIHEHPIKQAAFNMAVSARPANSTGPDVIAVQTVDCHVYVFCADQTLLNCRLPPESLLPGPIAVLFNTASSLWTAASLLIYSLSSRSLRLHRLQQLAQARDSRALTAAEEEERHSGHATTESDTSGESAADETDDQRQRRLGEAVPDWKLVMGETVQQIQVMPGSGSGGGGDVDSDSPAVILALGSQHVFQVNEAGELAWMRRFETPLRALTVFKRDFEAASVSATTTATAPDTAADVAKGDTSNDKHDDKSAREQRLRDARALNRIGYFLLLDNGELLVFKGCQMLWKTNSGINSGSETPSFASSRMISVHPLTQFVRGTEDEENMTLLTMLSDNHTLSIGYLGMSPIGSVAAGSASGASSNALTPAEGRPINYTQTDREMRVLQDKVKKIGSIQPASSQTDSNSSAISAAASENSAAEQREQAQLQIHVDQPDQHVESTHDNQLYTINISVRSKIPLRTLVIHVNSQAPLCPIREHRCFQFSEIKPNQEPLHLSIAFPNLAAATHLDRQQQLDDEDSAITANAIPSSLRADLVFSYRNAITDRNCLIHKSVVLPLALLFRMVPAVKQAANGSRFRVTIETTDQACVNLASLFADVPTPKKLREEFDEESLAQFDRIQHSAIGMRYELGFTLSSASVGTTPEQSDSPRAPTETIQVTILASQTSNRYRLQTDRFEFLLVILDELIRRLKQQFGFSSLRIKLVDDAVPLEPVQMLLQYYAQAKTELCSAESELEKCAEQYRAVQRRLLSRYRDQIPESLAGLDFLLENCVGKLNELSDIVRGHQTNLCTVNSALKAAFQFLLRCIQLKLAAVDEQKQQQQQQKGGGVKANDDLERILGSSNPPISGGHSSDSLDIVQLIEWSLSCYLQKQKGGGAVTSAGAAPKRTVAGEMSAQEIVKKVMRHLSVLLNDPANWRSSDANDQAVTLGTTHLSDKSRLNGATQVMLTNDDMISPRSSRSPRSDAATSGDDQYHAKKKKKHTRDNTRHAEEDREANGNELDVTELSNLDSLRNLDASVLKLPNNQLNFSD